MALIENNKKTIIIGLVVGSLVFISIIGFTITLVLDNQVVAVKSFSSERKLVMGIFPRRNSVKTIRMFKPIAEYVSKNIGVDIQIETAKDFRTFWENVKLKKYDIVHYNQLHYILSNKEQGYSIFLKNNEFGKSFIKPTIIVRDDSDIKSLADLRNKSIHFGGGRLAMSSHVAVRVAIRDFGLDDTDYKWSYAKNPPAAARSAYNLGADAAGLGDAVLLFPEVQQSFNNHNFIKIYSGPELPHLPWAVSEKVSSDLVLNIQAAMMKLNYSDEGKSLLKKASLSGFEVAIDDDYDGVREIYGKYLKYNEAH